MSKSLNTISGDAVDYNHNTCNGSNINLYSVNVTVSTSTNNLKTKLYPKRYFILIIFILYSMSNAFHWIQYSIIDNIITEYYETTTFWVNCTSAVYMVAYIIGIMPATWILDKKGLRLSVLLGSFGTCFGSWIKCLSVAPNRFWVTMIGQTIIAISQLFVLNIPPFLAAIWFSDKEVSRATAYGVFGNQVGIALGFVIPSLIVPNFRDNTTNSIANNVTNDEFIGVEEVSYGLMTLFIGFAICATLLFIIIYFFFNDTPPLPPSAAQASAQLLNKNSSFFDSIKSLATNPNFILLFITYGLNTGVFYAVSTVLNQMVTGVFGAEYVKEAGYIGLTIILTGILGSIVCGYLLDWTRLFKEITFGTYVMSLLGMIAFTIVLKMSSIWLLFIVSGILGFFMTGYLPIGFEFAAEISYPQPEGTSAGLLNASANIFGILFTFGGSAIIENINSMTANVVFVCALALGAILTFVIKPDLRRQAADHNKHGFDNNAMSSY